MSDAQTVEYIKRELKTLFYLIHASDKADICHASSRCLSGLSLEPLAYRFDHLAASLLFHNCLL